MKRKREVERDEPKPITAQPPPDAVAYDVPETRARSFAGTAQSAPGCYLTPRRRGAE